MLPRLEELCLEIVGKCYMDCIHCSSSCTSDNKDILDRVKVRSLLQQAKSLGATVVEISGGEPFLHPELLGIIEDSKKDFEVRLYTSGYTSGDIHDGGVGEKLVCLQRLGLDKIIFNLEGATRETHEKITRTEGSFARVINGIRSAKILGMWTGVHFVPMGPNFRELGLVARLCADLTVNELAVLRFVSQGRGEKYESQLSLSIEDFDELLKSIIHIKKIYGNFPAIRTGCPLNFCSILEAGCSPLQCKAGISTLLVDFKGDVSLCPAFKQASALSLGNVWEKSLISLWETSEILQSFRNMDVEKVHFCNGCEYKLICHGRCVAQRYHEYGSIFQGPDPLCPVTSAGLIHQNRKKVQTG